MYVTYLGRDGAVWAGTLSGGISRLKDGKFTTYTTTDGLASNTVSSVLEGHDGTIWFGTPNGLSAFSNGKWRTYSLQDGLPSDNVNCLFEDSAGALWIGTSAGLAYFQMGRMHTLQEVPESLREQIVGMAEDKSGRFWIATSNHVLRVPHDKLQSGVVTAADVREYGQADGLESTEGVKRSRSVVSDSAGRIWFSLSSGLSVVNPSQITDNSVPALPHIEAITADNNTANLDASVRIPPSPRRITFEYTGLSLAVPGRIRFRYFLENFDSSWSQPVAAREAVYTNLGPGSYRFRLVASNSEGLWNGPETAIALNVAPAYYQTYWFRFVVHRRLYCAALGRLSNACSPVAGAGEEIPRRSRNHAGPGFRCRPQRQSHFYEQGMARIHRIELGRSRQVQDGRRRFTPTISSASPNDGARRRRLANRWIMKRGFAADRTESIAGS